MLVLSRKVNEVLLIGDNIKITVIRIGPNTVRLGIDAPRHINVVREELIDAPTETDRSPAVGVSVNGNDASETAAGNADSNG